MDSFPLDQEQPIGEAEAEAFFSHRASICAAREKQHDRRALYLMQARVAVFLLLAACLALGGFGYGPRAAWFGAAGLLGIAFSALVHAQARENFARLSASHLWALQQEALARRKRDWKRIRYRPPPAEELAGGQRSLVESLAKDLDLSGPHSIYHLFCQAQSIWGRAKVHEWLRFPARPADIIRRQQAARELAPFVNFRQRLALFGRLAASSEGENDGRRLVAWAEEESWLLTRPVVLWAARMAPAVLLLLVVLWSIGVLPGSLPLLAAVANLAFTFVFASRIHAIFAAVSTQHNEVQRYADMLEVAFRGPKKSPLLADMHLAITAGEGDYSAAQRMGRLANLANLANLRYSPMLYFFLQTGLLWDFHVLWALEKWRAKHGHRLAAWLETLGELEALASWGGAWHENPSWTFPEVDHAFTALEAQSLAHPLLPGDRRVANDVEVGPPGTFLLVTGSNMSGKSTLLRSIGVGALLAQAGAPVCAARMAMPPLRVATSMRIQDSLEDGVSFFMAELKRLKQIVDLGQRQCDDEPPLLYLLDEILQGTNTAERQIAVRQVLAHLLEEGAIGAVSSHDLALAEHPSLASACRSVHFRETLHSTPGAPPMTFDYRLRPGLATTTNALKLLELVGLTQASPGQASVGDRSSR